MVKKTFSVAVACLLAVTGCTDFSKNVSLVKDPGQYSSVIHSSPVSNQVTPLEPMLRCVGRHLGSGGVSIAVGDVRDYTGKSTADDGMAITQGGALMAYSALGKMAPGVQLHERFDTRIADAELAYIKNRQLGDGAMHEIPESEDGGSSTVPWKPYFGGSVLQSDYYIVGGITEVNYNIRTTGAELQINQIGPKAREYVMNVAVDLRIVGSQSLKVYKTATVQKQLVGYEVGFEVFRFFESDLFDFNAGSKSQEPVQFGVRMAIEEAVFQLVSAVVDVDSELCSPEVDENLHDMRLPLL
ncbi:CsgG/HfaB family protein [Pseudogemmobacter sp. W21_MBD1_M6]|uniref:CsgG/HfaB family protein n=1 Tax=Pseudogemmobacter sp. W21_MBD1_M6 TaxID=3240271 RepID=UPI003F966A2D